ncbi:MAG: metal-sulfur cluster assembly factor [Chloroflexota bacterium]|nr:metal-sulfur cluster assembly factor [Chloroflexota bacterium]
MVTEDQVWSALKEVNDPEIPVNIVDLGLIYGVTVDGDKVHVKMTMTAPGCPMHSVMTRDAKQRVEKIEGVKEAEVELVWEPRWTPERLTEGGRKALGWG